MTSDSSIINILREQIAAYRNLFDLLKLERRCLVEIDAMKIEQISKEKDTVIMRLRLLEEERQRLVERFAEEHGLSGKATLKDIAGISGKKVFVSLRSQLLSLLQSIEEMNEFNSILIERSISYVKNTANFIQSFRQDEMPLTKGALLSRET